MVTDIFLLYSFVNYSIPYLSPPQRGGVHKPIYTISNGGWGNSAVRGQHVLARTGQYVFTFRFGKRCSRFSEDIGKQKNIRYQILW